VVVRILQKVNTVTLSWDEKKYDEAVKELKNIITTPTYFKENRKEHWDISQLPS
jgi:translation elongation factor EF-1alpha